MTDLDSFKLGYKNKKESEEEIKSKIIKHAEKEYEDFKIVGWSYYEETHEGVLHMEKK